VGVSLEGYLHKRKVVGFRIWKRRYVVLRGAELRWLDHPDGETKGSIHLAGHSAIVKDRRSVILSRSQSCDAFTGTAQS
jgi:hypothetical protein